LAVKVNVEDVPSDAEDGVMAAAGPIETETPYGCHLINKAIRHRCPAVVGAVILLDLIHRLELQRCK